jgi:hypothetical protein
MRCIVCFVLLFFAFTSCKKEEKRYLVISKVKSAAKLATTETHIDKIIFGTQEKRLLWIIHLNEAKFVAYSEATVKSGIDLEKIHPEDVKIKDKKIEILLPPVEVLDFSYPFSKYRIDSNITQNAFLNTLDIQDHEYFYQQAELDIRNNLEYSGIKQATELKTRVLLTTLLKNLGYEEIYITFKKGKLIQTIDPDNI